MEELITVDAIGCFEGEDDYEEDRNEEEVAVFDRVCCMTSCAPLNLFLLVLLSFYLNCFHSILLIGRLLWKRQLIMRHMIQTHNMVSPQLQPHL